MRNPMIQTIRKRCIKLNVQLKLGKGLTCLTPDGDRCEGYFIEPTRTLPGVLAVATGRPTNAWQYTLCHEYAHMLQWWRDDPILREDYLTLERATEKEALKIANEFGLKIEKCRQESRNYIAYLRSIQK